VRAGWLQYPNGSNSAVWKIEASRPNISFTLIASKPSIGHESIPIKAATLPQTGYPLEQILPPITTALNQTHPKPKTSLSGCSKPLLLIK